VAVTAVRGDVGGGGAEPASDEARVESRRRAPPRLTDSHPVRHGICTIPRSAALSNAEPRTPSPAGNPTMSKGLRGNRPPGDGFAHLAVRHGERSSVRTVSAPPGPGSERSGGWSRTGTRRRRP